MRVLICAVLFGRGGTETHLLHLCKLLSEQGHEVILACRYANRSVPLVERHKALGIKRLLTPFDKNLKHYRWSTIAAILLWPFFLSQHRVDVIITLEYSRFLHFLRLFLKPKGSILLLRAGLPAKPTEYIPQDILSRFDGVLVESSLQATASLIAHPKLPTKAIPLLGNINPNIPVRRKFNGGILSVAFLGRFDSKKGIYRLVDLWSYIKLTNVRLQFYGHGIEKSALIAYIAQKGLSHDIQVNDGWITPSELTDIMEALDLIILPSEEEGLPVVLMEAMAHGVPFVATDVGAVRTYAENNPDVLVVPLDNQSIVSAIEEMVHAIREGQIDGGRLQQYYQDRYSFKTLSNEWIDAIENVELWIKNNRT